MSRHSDAKTARRRKRQAARSPDRIPAAAGEQVAEELEIAADLEDFDDRLIARGWVSVEDVDDGVSIAWYWPPSDAEVDDEDEQATATVILLTPDDGGEVAHAVFVGTSDDYQFGLDELFEYLDAIEAYRIGNPLSRFG